MSEDCKQKESSSGVELGLDELENVAGGSIWDFMHECIRCGAAVPHPTFTANHGYCDACVAEKAAFKIEDD